MSCLDLGDGYNKDLGVERFRAAAEVLSTLVLLATFTVSCFLSQQRKHRKRHRFLFGMDCESCFELALLLVIGHANW